MRRVRLGETGPGAPGADGPAVTGGRRAIGSMLLLDADWAAEGAFREPATNADHRTARFPLEGPGVLLTGLAPDLLDLRRELGVQLAALESGEPAAQGPMRSEPAIS